MSNLKSENPIVQNALGVYEALREMYLDRAAQEGKMGDLQEAEDWRRKAWELEKTVMRTENSVKSSLDQQRKITKDFSIAKDKNTGKWLVLAGHWNPIRYCDTRERALDVAYGQQFDVDRTR